MRYLLDTCVVSDLISTRPTASVEYFLDITNSELLNLSAITIGEIYRGIIRLDPSRRKTRLFSWLNDDLRVEYSGRILAVNESIMMVWGELMAELENRGRPLPALDSIVAATALTYDMTVVTRNVRDFVDTGVVVHNPWIDTDNGADSNVD